MPTASLCIIGRCLTTHKGITTHKPAKTTELLVETNSRHIKLDGNVFINLTRENAMIPQLVSLTPQVTCLFLSRDVCQQLRSTPLDFPAQVPRTV